MPYLHSFPPVSLDNATTLILGSMPGKASLSAQQYYAHPRNAFWHILETVFGIPRTLPYRARLEAVTNHRIAIWDVLKTCTRESSLDSDIVESSMVPNDFATFFAQHMQITHVFFNGTKPEQVFMRHVYPLLKNPQKALQYERLPSTSPANAQLSMRDKTLVWEKALIR